MTFESLSLKKRIIVTQLLSVFFACTSEMHTRLLIANDWLFSSYTLFYIGILILIIIFTILIYFYLDGKWINVVLITISYIFCGFIIIIVGSLIYPTHTDPDDYGIGLLGVFASINQWISVVVAIIIGTFLKRMHHSNRNL